MDRGDFLRKAPFKNLQIIGNFQLRMSGRLVVDNEVLYWVDTEFDRLHDIRFVLCDFQGVFIWKCKHGMKRIGMVRPLINRKPIRDEMTTVSCKQKANSIWKQSDMNWSRYQHRFQIFNKLRAKSYDLFLRTECLQRTYTTGWARKKFPLLKIHNTKATSRIWIIQILVKSRKIKVILSFFLLSCQHYKYR